MRGKKRKIVINASDACPTGKVEISLRPRPLVVPEGVHRVPCSLNVELSRRNPFRG